MKLSYNTIDHDGRVWVLLKGRRPAKEGWPVFYFPATTRPLQARNIVQTATSAGILLRYAGQPWTGDGWPVSFFCNPLTFSGT
jgi:hypothetical protein